MADWHNTSTTAAAEDNDDIGYHSRRSPILSTNGSVATSQPLASSIGLQILTKGGNAADAAIAISAALMVIEPCSCGLGGDMFSLYFDANAEPTDGDSNVNGNVNVKAINGSGRCPGNLNLDVVKKAFPKMNNSNDETDKVTVDVDANAFRKSVHSVTVPGAAYGLEVFYNAHASKKFTFAELFEPAAILAEEGFPIAPITSRSWKTGLENDIKKWLNDDEKVPLSINGSGRAPDAGEIMKNPDLAKVFRSLGKHGAMKGFYQAFPGQNIVKAVQKHGGVMTMEDLSEDLVKSTKPETISVEYRGLKLHQIPPNGQGIAGLIALSGVEALESSGKIPCIETKKDGSGWASSQTLHAMIEMTRLGFADARANVCDTAFHEDKLAKSKSSLSAKSLMVSGTWTGEGDDIDVNADTDNTSETRNNFKSNDDLLDKNRISSRAKRVFKPDQAVVHGMPDPTSCTVSFQVVDGEGNAVSFVNSNYMGFGTGIVPDQCGFTLQNRGGSFTVDQGPDHPNVIEPHKRPYHTIIPGMLTHADTNELYATISNMGGFMQPQGHMQLTIALACGLDPQAAVDLPRFCITDGTYNGAAMIEKGVGKEVEDNLQSMGHNMVTGISGYGRSLFGKAQIIKRDRETGVLWAGSDGRCDGCAMGY